ncbi:peptidase C1-like family protein [Biscogniauxia mediterranea]|nr:peptidase C1-like family protein [Biscogniauxia mediterranea]
MGAQTSKIQPEMSSREKVVLDRLASLSLEVDGHDDFVHVDKDVNEKNVPNYLWHREPEGLTVGLTKDWQSKLLQDPKNRLALSALSGANPRDVLASRAAHIADQHVFNVRIPLEGAPVTNQRASGRCWLFASTNVFRVALMRRYGLHDFELSQAYLFFWDKLEKANYFLENIISTTAAAAAGEEDHALDGRLVQRLFADPASDGGQWDMVCNLVRKYGLVPQALYPDAWSAQSSAVLNYVVVGKLREYGLALRRLAAAATTSAATLQATKESMVREIHAVLTLALGPPPSATEPFVWEFADAAGAARQVRKTPLEFARDIAAPAPGPLLRALDAPTILDAYVSLVHDPRHTPLTRLTVDRLGNVVGGRGITYVNVTMATLKRACADMLRAGLPVFFGCDVGKFSSKEDGVMDLGLVDYGLGFGVDMYRGKGGLDKEARLRVGESAMTHAMVLTGVHVEEGDKDKGKGKGKAKGGDQERYARWRVQNSWGPDVGDKGWFLMSDAWMDEFVYQAVVDPHFLAQEVRDVLKQEPVVLPLWDPMGSLA